MQFPRNYLQAYAKTTARMLCVVCSRTLLTLITVLSELFVLFKARSSLPIHNQFHLSLNAGAKFSLKIQSPECCDANRVPHMVMQFDNRYRLRPFYLYDKFQARIVRSTTCRTDVGYVLQRVPGTQYLLGNSGTGVLLETNTHTHLRLPKHSFELLSYARQYFLVICISFCILRRNSC